MPGSCELGNELLGSTNDNFLAIGGSTRFSTKTAP
jgi:hypothetical protein